MSRWLGLTGRVAAAAGLSFAVVLAIFVALAISILHTRQESDERRDSQRAALAVQNLQKSVLDMETGVRAFLVTRQDRFLGPWRAARDRLPMESQNLLARIRDVDGPTAPAFALARRVVSEVDGYFYEQSLPLVLRARSRRLSQNALVTEISEGKTRVDRLRIGFAQLLGLEAARTRAEDASATRTRSRTLLVGSLGLALILSAIVGGIAHLARTVTRPVVRVAEAAAALARDGRNGHEPLSAANAHAAPEVKALTESFDSMSEIVLGQRDRLLRQNTLLEKRVRERTTDLEQARYESLLMLAVAAEYRDDDTHRHTQRVGRNAALVAERLGLGSETVELLRVAAPLHDVGKIGISDSIMLKPGKLTPAEFETMKRHVLIGEAILGSSSEPLFHVAAEIARSHHERWDGTGYVDGLRGEQIPLAGRIVAVVDVFDALTHARPYKDAWPLERALAEIDAGAGSHFDPAVVEAFASIDPDVFRSEVKLVSSPAAENHLL